MNTDVDRNGKTGCAERAAGQDVDNEAGLHAGIVCRHEPRKSRFQERDPVRRQCLGAVPARRYGAQPRVARHSRRLRNAWRGRLECSIERQGG